MKVYKDLRQLSDAAKKAAQKTAQKEVADLVKEEIVQQEQKLVYDSYSPVYY